MSDNNFDNKAPRGSISQIILKALSSGNKYGYEICKDIEKITNGKLILKQPSLYSSLRRMEEQGLISSYWEDSDLGGKRHYYTLTETGKALVKKDSSILEEDLISSLPLNKENTATINTEEENFDNANKTSVVKQENLFGLSNNRHFEDSTANSSNNNETENKDNQSFFQFDLFNQNVSFIKEESSKPKEEIKSFVNKYFDLDNHMEEIEPENSYTEQQSTTPLYFTRNNEEENTLQKTNNNTEEEFSSYLNATSANLESEEETLIKREKNDSNAQISWESNGIETFEDENNDDYKSIIGQLYNNSRLLDPYEQNKFQNFKELFPKTNFKEEDSNLSKKIQFEESQSQEKIKSIIKSSKESNIDCEDIRNLNNLYNLQGIEIKVHDKKENAHGDTTYTDKNKLNMVRAWILSAIMLLEILFSYVILKSNKFILPKQRIIFYLFLAAILSYFLISSSENLLDRYRLVVIKQNFKKSIIYRLFALLVIVILVFTVNIMFGMTSLFQVDFFVYWFIPILMATNLLVSAIIYEFLLKSKKFDN